MKVALGKLFLPLILAMTAFVSPGCGGAKKIEPMSVAEWQTLPPLDKYQQDNLDRLKESDPKFQAEDIFDTFVHYQRLKDFPDFGKK